MTDLELLEAAAKAAGWSGRRSKHGYWNVTSPEGKESTHCHYWNAYCTETGEKLPEPTFADAIAEADWNPLADDGDALRLAVKLLFATEVFAQFVQVVTQDGDVFRVMASELDDPYAATRRAIVRAAAEIGRG